MSAQRPPRPCNVPCRPGLTHHAGICCPKYEPTHDKIARARAYERTRRTQNERGFTYHLSHTSVAAHEPPRCWA